MSLKRNILASFASQIYVTLVGVLILPMYLKYMGAEAYGLVGFFTMLQVFFNLLDMGLSPTVARETARFRGGATDALTYRRLLRALQVIFFAVAGAGGGTLFMFSGLIATKWINVQTLPFAQVKLALQLIAISVALRWVSGLYRGCISGSERLVWLGGFNAFVATLRFIGVIPVLIWIGNSPAVFFTYQLIVAVIELVGLALRAHSLAPAVLPGQKIGWLPALVFLSIKPVLKFSLTIAFTSAVWVLVTQLDKLVLSKLLPLADYGYFTLAVLAASGVLLISGPISNALMPRMARLQAEGDDAGLITLYRNATQLVAVIAIPACLILAFFSEQVLWLWTSNAQATAKASSVLRLYALGNGLLALAAFPYYLQFAKGDLRLHSIGSALFVVLLVPAIILGTLEYGVVGAGWAWLGANLVYFLVWVPKVHARFLHGLHMHWLRHDIGVIALPTAIVAAIAYSLIKWSYQRTSIAIDIAVVSLLLMIVAAAGASLVRKSVYDRWVT